MSIATAVDPREADRLAVRAGMAIKRTAKRQKQIAIANKVCKQRASQIVSGQYVPTQSAYQAVANLARHSETDAFVVVQDLEQLAIEAGYGDLETPALLRELAIQQEAVRTSATAMTRVAAILSLLQERIGVAP